jgi:hypothetical protein
LAVEWPGHEIVDSPLFSAEDKNASSCMPLGYGAELKRGIMTLSLCSWLDKNSWKAAIKIDTEMRNI